MMLNNPRDWRNLESAMSEVAAENGLSAETFDIMDVGVYKLYFVEEIDPDVPTVIVPILYGAAVGKPRVMTLNQAREMIARWERDAMYEGESGDVG